VQPVDGRGLQAVPVAQALRDEVHDVAAKKLEGPAQNHRRGDAVDVVVAVDRDPLAPRERALEPFDRPIHAGQLERVVQVFDGRVQKAPGIVRVCQPTKAQQPRDQRVHPELGAQRSSLLRVARQVIPEQGLGHADAAGGLSVSMKDVPSSPILRNLS
jgi:hypothetical protein